jgi:cardiolipin synthase
MKMLPNIITVCRLIAVPVTVYFILVGELQPAFWLFVAAGVSDAVDGAVARLCNARTALGAVLDPLADKALLVSVYLSLTHSGLVPLWLTILVVSRDLLIIASVLLLAFLLRKPVPMEPLTISKINTLAQLVLAGLVLAVYGLGVPTPDILGHSMLSWLMAVVAGTTVLSGMMYLIASDLVRDRLGDGGPGRDSA